MNMFFGNTSSVLWLHFVYHLKLYFSLTAKSVLLFIFHIMFMQ